MALDNSKTITAVTYNGNDWPVGGAPSLQSKSVTYTSNGTATITPDAGYDGLSSVNVTVDVASGGGGGVETCILTLHVSRSPIDNPGWIIEVYPTNLTAGESILLDFTNPNAKIVLPNNGMFALVTYNRIEDVNTSNFGVFNATNNKASYGDNPDIIYTYICYAGETGSGTWDIVFQ